MVLTPAKDFIDVGILVGDIKTSLAFYQGTLGLEKIEEMQMPFNQAQRWAGADLLSPLHLYLDEGRREMGRVGSPSFKDSGRRLTVALALNIPSP